jgi:hypothetical protein
MTSSSNLPVDARTVECPTHMSILTRVAGARARLRKLDAEHRQPRDLP